MVRELVSCFDRSVAFMRDQVADLTDDEMTAVRPGVPNHAAWTLGHVIHGCQAIACELGAQPWLPGDWEAHFASGTAPGGTPARYAVRDVLLELLADTAARLRTVLLSLDETGLAAPLPDREVRAILPTVGDAVLQVVAAHTAFHAGQLAVWRRAIGRAPVGLFV